MNRLTSLIFFFLILLGSCSKDEGISVGGYQKGTFIVNEGPFQAGTGTVTYYDGTQITQDIFGTENNGNALGNIAQSMIKMNDKYFIAVNNADKVQVVNAADFKSIGEISNVFLPRFFATAGDKLYLTSYTRDFTSGAIYQLDPDKLSITATIPVSGLAERVVSKDDFLYITVTSSEFDVFPRNVLVLDTKTNTFVDTITVGDNPNDITFDKNGDLWVLCSGFTNWSDPSLSTLGSLHRVRNGISVEKISLPNGAKGLAANGDGNKLFYLADGKVFEHSITGDQKVIAQGNFYSIGLDQKVNKLYVSDALDFQKSGIVSQFDLNTLVRIDFEAGIIPGFFYFAE